MKIVRTIEEVRQTLVPLRSHAPIGFVPTMGAWHDGHVALIRAAHRGGCIVVASIFVNPAQFNDPRDLAAYPRDEIRDARMAAAAGVDVLFIPSVEEIYPAEFATSIDVEGAARGLEGELRPGHFNGVATVCLKLFHIVDPAVAFFGQKDAQQVAVIEQLVRDLNLPSGPCRPCAMPTDWRSRRGTSDCRPTSGVARSRFHRRSPPASRPIEADRTRSLPRGERSPDSPWSTCRSPILAAGSRSPPRLASVRFASSTTFTSRAHRRPHRSRLFVRPLRR